MIIRSLADAIIYKKNDLVEQLLDSGEDPNEIDDYGYTPLIEAAIVSNNDAAAMLLKRGADVNTPDATGNTPLHWAVQNHNRSLAEVLLLKGADPNAYNMAAEPILVHPLLRNQTEIKNLLFNAGANLDFALDYINTKLIGHRFELRGSVDIVNAKNQFIELKFEGFVPEFTAAILYSSLKRFSNHFAGRHYQKQLIQIKKVINSLAVAAELIRYQHIHVDIADYSIRINELLDTELLMLPGAFTGHAVSFVKYKNLFVRIDRGEYGRNNHTVQIYHLHKQRAFTKEFIKDFLYTKHDENFFHHQINTTLGLMPLTTLDIAPQITGNCSWANFEAAIPVMLLLLNTVKNFKIDYGNMEKNKNNAIAFFKEWQHWEKDTALNELITQFETASLTKQAAIVSILTAILFQTCDYNNPMDLKRADKILPIILTKRFRYVLKSYIKVYANKKMIASDRLLFLLQLCDIDLDDVLD